jgi:hypothetical protein
MKKELEIKIRVEQELHKLFKSYCKENGYNMGGLLGKMIKELLKNKS